jgi:hypothetical protein
VGVIPRLFKTDGVFDKPVEGMPPFAFGFSLYLDIRRREDE